MTEEVTQADRMLAEQWRFIECMHCSQYEGDFVNDLAADFARHRIANQPPAQDGLVEALQELLKIGVPRMWKCERGDYCVSIMQKEYFGATLSEAADAALASLGDKP